MERDDAEFAASYGPWALIAGGSEGLGAAFADRLAARGINLILVARKPEPLAALASEIAGRHGVGVRQLALDLTSPDAIAAIVDAASTCDIGMIVYNAGADSRVCDFLGRPAEESDRLIALNVSAPTRLVRQFAPAMARRGRGGIVLVSSFASATGTPGNALYASTKAFSNVFAEGMWYELGQHGIHVLGVIVGIVRTPAMERMGMTFEGVAQPGDPYALVDETLANIANGPTLCAGGIGEEVQRLRTLPRGDAVRAIAAFSQAAQATGKP